MATRTRKRRPNPAEVAEQQAAAEDRILAVVEAKSRVLEVLDAFVPDGDFRVGDVIEDVLDYMQTQEGETFLQFQEAVAKDALRDILRHRLNSQRAHLRATAPARRFALAARQFEAGDLTAFDTTYVVGPDSTRRHVRDMTGQDHRYVADNYESTATRQALLATFHRHIAKKVGNQRTEDAMDVATYNRIYNDIVGRATPTGRKAASA